MLFNSIEYLIYLPIVFLLYWLVFGKRLRLQNLFVVVVSYLFYGWWDYRFLALIALTSFCSWLSGIGIEEVRARAGKIPRWFDKGIVVANVIFNLLILSFFKYYDFFVDSLVDAFSYIGISLHISTLSLLLPVGISFYTFQALSYTIDVYRGKLPVTRDIVSFFAFVSFFPQLVAGPIERATNLLIQFERPRSFEYNDAVDGIRQMMWGFFKKILIANNCALVVDDIFGNYGNYPASTLLLGAVLFSFQIYGDFSGYSDMAVGSAKCIGYDFNRNFNLPYIAKNVSEFWKRWHISLSTWLQEYLYIPLGGNRKGKIRTYINLMLTMIIGGLWHGASWNFVLWGALHGLALCVHKIFMAIYKPNHKHTFTTLISVLVTYIFVSLCWIPFRSTDIHFTLEILKRIFIWQDGILQIHSWTIFSIIVLILGTAAAIIKAKRTGETKFISGYYKIMSLDKFSSLICIILFIGIILGLAYTNSNPFIYFQF